MHSSLRLLALIASLAPLSVTAQNSGPPSYSFGMFPGIFGNNNSFTVPQGYMNQGQSPFMTMPAPQYPYSNPQFPNAPRAQAAPFPANPMAQPTPYWMQTPNSPQPNARYITDVPSRTAPAGGQGYTLYPPNVPNTVSPRNTPPGYTVFSAPGFTPGPSRWAPMPGHGPVNSHPRPTNNWAIFQNGSTAPAPAVPATPPKWPTP